MVTPKFIIYKIIGITFNIIIFDSVLLEKSQLHPTNKIIATIEEIIFNFFSFFILNVVSRYFFIKYNPKTNVVNM